MKLFNIVLGLTGMTLIGCAGNHQAVERSIGQAEGNKTIAAESMLDASAVSSASGRLDSAKIYDKSLSYNKAINSAELSSLEFKIAILSAERDSLKKEDARVESELREDENRAAVYQKLLNEEIGGAN